MAGEQESAADVIWARRAMLRLQWGGGRRPAGRAGMDLLAVAARNAGAMTGSVEPAMVSLRKLLVMVAVGGAVSGSALVGSAAGAVAEAVSDSGAVRWSG